MTDDQTQAMNEIMASIRKAVVAGDGATDEPLLLDSASAVGDERHEPEWPADRAAAPATTAALAAADAVSSDPAVSPPHPAALPAGETSLEGLVRSLLEPMLKSWLDTNLPEIVERATQAEIARLTGR